MSCWNFSKDNWSGLLECHMCAHNNNWKDIASLNLYMGIIPCWRWVLIIKTFPCFFFCFFYGLIRWINRNLPELWWYAECEVINKPFHSNRYYYGISNARRYCNYSRIGVKVLSNPMDRFNFKKILFMGNMWKKNKRVIRKYQTQGAQDEMTKPLRCKSFTALFRKLSLTLTSNGEWCSRKAWCFTLY